MTQNFIVVTDSGTSTTKGAGSYGGAPQFVSLTPYCAKDYSGECNRLRRAWGDTEVAIESAWVQDVDGAYLLGEGAREIHGAGILTDELKYKKALYKTLALVGYFSTKFSVPNGAQIRIGALLPFSEYASSREIFTNELIQALKNFEYCGRLMRFSLSPRDLFVRPEGGGVFMGGVAPDVARQGSVTVVNAGFRNISALFHQNGMLSPAKSDTCNLGYRWLVNRVAKQSGRNSESWIFEQIVSPHGDEEIKRYAQLNLDVYWEQVSTWLSTQPVADQVVFCGGTAQTLRPYIASCVKNSTWPEKLHAKVKKIEPDDLKAFLYMDLYGVHLSILSSLKKAAIA